MNLLAFLLRFRAHVGLFVITERSDPANPGDPAVKYPKFVWVNLLVTGVTSGAVNSNSTIQWNWPGGEVAKIGVNTVSTQCSNINIPSLGFNSPQNYDIPLRAVFSCACDKLNRFQILMPNGAVKVTGLIFFAEAANATAGELEFSIKDVRID